MKKRLLFPMCLLLVLLPFGLMAQYSQPITYSTLLENQSTPFTNGDGEVLFIENISWERSFGEKEYVLAPMMQNIQEYRSRITKLDIPEQNIFKSKFKFLKVVVNEQSKALLKEMGINVKDYVHETVNVYLPEIDIDVLIQNNINFSYLTDYGKQQFSGENVQDIQLTTLFTEGFEGAFPGSTYTTALFGSANCGWDDVSCYKHSGAWSVWCASLGAACNSCLSDYVNDMGSEFYKQNTINTSGYNDFWFKFWMDYDFYNIGSNDELTRYYWNGTSWTLSTTSYTSASALDGDLWNQHSFFYAGTIPNYSFDFAFYSNSVGTSYGVYIDDIEFSGTAISTASVDENKDPIAIITTPNPFTDNVIVSLESLNDSEGQIAVYSADGKLMHSSKIEILTGNSNFKIETGNWAAGTYIVKVATEDGFSATKIIKQ